jgi:hypothetical protein
MQPFMAPSPVDLDLNLSATAVSSSLSVGSVIARKAQLLIVVIVCQMKRGFGCTCCLPDVMV